MRDTLYGNAVHVPDATIHHGSEVTIHRCSLSAGVFVAPALAVGATILLAVLLKFHRPFGLTHDDVWMAILLLLAADTLLFLARFVAYDTGEIRLTNRRLRAKLAPWNEVELDINAIDSVELYESALGEDGTIVVVPKAASPLVLSHVPAPERLYNQILDQQRIAQSKPTASAEMRTPIGHRTQESHGFAA